jgi:hypothetical protein
MPPGAYQARLTMDGATRTQRLTVLIDPRIAAEGVTSADLVEQYEHNVKMRELQAAVTQLVSRARDARGRLQNATGADADKAKQVQAIYDKLVNTPEGVRYNKPGLQEHVNYLAGMTANTDQKIARDAIALRRVQEGVRRAQGGVGQGHRPAPPVATRRTTGTTASYDRSRNLHSYQLLGKSSCRRADER